MIMAKAPRAGEVKTRLCPPLSLADASELYRRFLLDKIDQVRALRTASPAIAYTPADANSLGELLDQGYRGALAIDSDTPTLPLGFLEQALDLLTTPEVDVVLGPTEDGGYYLIGLRTVYRELFDAMAWSTSLVLPDTLRRADAKGLRVACLPPWYDIDTPDDLARLRMALAASDGDSPRHTRAFFLERQG